MTCKHLHGAQVTEIGFWVCGQCYRKLEARPKQYGLAKFTGDVVRGGEKRQDIIWQAEERLSLDGTTLADFLKAMARQYMKRCHDLRNSKAAAYDCALEFMRCSDDEFGDRSMVWTPDAAADLADEDMDYWDQDDGLNNG